VPVLTIRHFPTVHTVCQVMLVSDITVLTKSSFLDFGINIVNCMNTLRRLVTLLKTCYCRVQQRRAIRTVDRAAEWCELHSRY
jgi:hypothetical protein